MYANLCESCKFMRIIRFRIHLNHEFMRIYSIEYIWIGVYSIYSIYSNRIYSIYSNWIYSNWIYSIGIDFFIFAYIRYENICKYIRKIECMRIYANLCEYVRMLKLNLKIFKFFEYFWAVSSSSLTAKTQIRLDSKLGVKMEIFWVLLSFFESKCS